jgi:hypothetical protein
MNWTGNEPLFPGYPECLFQYGVVVGYTARDCNLRVNFL